MHDPSGDLRRLYEALEREWGLRDLACDLRVLQALQPALRAGELGGHGRRACRQADRRRSGPGCTRSAYGLAVDVGSTTIAAHLCDLQSGDVVASAGVMNPQIRFGEDLMSRVSYSMMNPGGAGADDRGGARGAVGARGRCRAGRRACRTTTSSRRPSSATRSCITCCSASTRSSSAARRSRLRPTCRRRMWASEIELKLNRNARIYVLPCIAGHVGADAAGMVLAERPDLADEMTLLVDVGTNAEIVLGNRDRLVACSSPTGPAFEGAQISCGQRAAPGAIERIRIDRATLEPRFKIIGSDLWSDEPGFDAAAAATGVTGVCGSGIIEAIAEMYLAGIINQDGVVDGRLAERSTRIVPNGRTFAYVLHRGAVELQDHADRRARDPARESGALCGHRAADGAARHRARRPDPPRRRVRQPHRRQVRDDPRHGPGLRPGAASAPPATPPAPARASRCSTRVRAARSRRWCGGSRRWRPRSSRASSTISSRPWRSRTRPPRTGDLRQVVDLPAPKESTSQAETRGRRPRRGQPVKES